MRSPPSVAKSSRLPSLLMPCSWQSCCQNCCPTLLPHWPAWSVMISLYGICISTGVHSYAFHCIPGVPRHGVKNWPMSRAPANALWAGFTRQVAKCLLPCLGTVIAPPPHRLSLSRGCHPDQLVIKIHKVLNATCYCASSSFILTSDFLWNPNMTWNNTV